MMCAQNFRATDTEENHQDYDDDFVDNAANDDSEKKCANIFDDDDGDYGEKKGANEAPTSFPPNKLVGAEKHLGPSDRPDQTRLQ